MLPRFEEEEESGSDEEDTHVAARQTFEDEHGVPIGFFIHKSVKKDQRNNLTLAIQARLDTFIKISLICL